MSSTPTPDAVDRRSVTGRQSRTSSMNASATTSSVNASSTVPRRLPESHGGNGSTGNSHGGNSPGTTRLRRYRSRQGDIAQAVLKAHMVEVNSKRPALPTPPSQEIHTSTSALYRVSTASATTPTAGTPASRSRGASTCSAASIATENTPSPTETMSETTTTTANADAEARATTMLALKMLNTAVFDKRQVVTPLPSNGSSVVADTAVGSILARIDRRQQLVEQQQQQHQQCAHDPMDVDDRAAVASLADTDDHDMEPPAKLNPLNVPELLSHILSFLETPLNTGTDPTQPLDFVKVDSIKYTVSKPKLHSCVLVSKLWNACATKFLYRHVKIGSDGGCRKLARMLAPGPEDLLDKAKRFPVAASLSERVQCTALDPSQCLPHMNMVCIPSPVNGWSYGALLSSFTLLPPHGPQGSDVFTEHNVDAVVTALALTCPKLLELNLSTCSQVSDASMVVVARHCRQLRHLNLNRCDLVSSTTVWELAASTCPLEILNLSRPLLQQRTHIEDAAALALVKRLPRLVELRMRNCDQITDATVIEMARTCGASLRALDLSWCGRLTDNVMRQGIALHCPQLLSLALNGCKRFTDASLSALLGGCPNMASLSLAHLPFITDAVLKDMASQLKKLEILSLNGCVNVGDESVIALAENCPRLQSLSLFSLLITDASVKAIAQQCTGLVSLSISGCKQVTDEGAISITSLRRLQSLYLNAAQITDRTVVAIANHCRLIRALSLNDCTDLTDRSIVVLSKFCTQLQSLSMNNCGVTAVGVHALSERCMDLREISVKGCTQCVLDGPEASKPVAGNGGMHNLTAVGTQVLAKLKRRRVALMRA